MKRRKMTDRTTMISAVDWHRRLFDAFMPLPDGTSYNAYLVRGSEKTALIDTVDPTFDYAFLNELEALERIDYIVSQHAEQDHSGLLPEILELFPEAQLLCSQKARGMLIDHLGVEENFIRPVSDGEIISLGDRSLEFHLTPWVHWPETLCTYLPEEKILFSCDLFGAHLATSATCASADHRSAEAAKLYYAQIMMPFSKIIGKHLRKLEDLDVVTIAPSHGPLIDQPQSMFEAYKSWISNSGKNNVVVPFVSMHGSTETMIDHLVDALMARDLAVFPFDLTATDWGRMAMALVDASTVVFGTPTVLNGPHPKMAYAATIIDALQPPIRYASLVGSYGWGSKLGQQVAAFLPHLKVEVLDPVLCRGLPRDEDLAALNVLADTIAEKQG